MSGDVILSMAKRIKAAKAERDAALKRVAELEAELGAELDSPQCSTCGVRWKDHHEVDNHDWTCDD